MHYLASKGPFGYYKEEEGSYAGILVWAFKSFHAVRELASFAIILLKIVVNQAGCE